MQDELDKIRQKKIQELQQGFQEQQEQKQQLQQELKQLETLIKQRMTKNAISRYGNVKLSHPQVAMSLLGLLVQLFEKNPERTINDEELKKLLIMINSSKKQKYSIKK